MSSWLGIKAEIQEEHTCYLNQKNTGSNFWACESSTGYALNAVAYAGNEGYQVCRNLGQGIVLTLMKPYYETGRDVCTDDFFTSYNLANLPLEKMQLLLKQ